LACARRPPLDYFVCDILRSCRVSVSHPASLQHQPGLIPSPRYYPTFALAVCKRPPSKRFLAELADNFGGALQCQNAPARQPHHAVYGQCSGGAAHCTAGWPCKRSRQERQANECAVTA
jgi:hypothetical protein